MMGRRRGAVEGAGEGTEVGVRRWGGPGEPPRRTVLSDRSRRVSRVRAVEPPPGPLPSRHGNT